MQLNRVKFVKILTVNLAVVLVYPSTDKTLFKFPR